MTFPCNVKQVHAVEVLDNEKKILHQFAPSTYLSSKNCLAMAILIKVIIAIQYIWAPKSKFNAFVQNKTMNLLTLA